MMACSARWITGALLGLAAASGWPQDCGDQGPLLGPDARYIVIQNGTVKDQTTGLMWKLCAEGLTGLGCAAGQPREMRWTDASGHAAASRFAGYADWRLPDREELLSLLQRRCLGLDIEAVTFPHTPASPFWSATPASYYPGSAWRVHFGNGSIDYGTRKDTAYVRLVRDAEACNPVTPGSCLPHEDRLYEPHGAVEELEDGSLQDGPRTELGE